MKRPWTIADVVDFECFLAEDSTLAPATLALRDRQLYLEKIAPSLGGESPQAERREVFRLWVEARRAEATKTPGEAFDAGWRAILVGSAIVGLCVGISVAAAVLRYPGLEPVNVWVFLGATLGPQLVIPIALAIVWQLLRPQAGAGWVARILCWLGAELRHLPGPKRQQLRVTLANFGQKKELFGKLALWPLLIITQVFAVAFNLGILAALIIHVPTRELRFGWQTTLEWQTESVAKVIGVVSAPWAWAPAARPSNEQLAATRYAPGQAHSTLSGEAMRAWWPFLAYAVLFYGLLLRAAALGWVLLRRRQSLQRLGFDHAEANALRRRLTGPTIITKDITDPLRVPPQEPAPPPARPLHGSALAVVDQDLLISETELAQGLKQHFGWQLTQTLRLKIDRRAEAAAALAPLRQQAPQLTAVTVFIPAERDPIVAIAGVLREIAAATAGPAEIILVLVGARQGTGSWAAVPEQRLKFWRDFNSIHHFHFGLEPWP